MIFTFLYIRQCFGNMFQREQWLDRGLMGKYYIRNMPQFIFQPFYKIVRDAFSLVLTSWTNKRFLSFMLFRQVKVTLASHRMKILLSPMTCLLKHHHQCFTTNHQVINLFVISFLFFFPPSDANYMMRMEKVMYIVVLFHYNSCHWRSNEMLTHWGVLLDKEIMIL